MGFTCVLKTSSAYYFFVFYSHFFPFVYLSISLSLSPPSPLSHSLFLFISCMRVCVVFNDCTSLCCPINSHHGGFSLFCSPLLHSCSDFFHCSVLTAKVCVQYNMYICTQRKKMPPGLDCITLYVHWASIHIFGLFFLFYFASDTSLFPSLLHSFNAPTYCFIQFYLSLFSRLFA